MGDSVKISSLKKLIKNNKELYQTIKCIYKPIKYAINYPEYKKLSLEAKEKLDHLQKNHKKTIFYFGIAIHPNLGDLAQTYCTELLCKKNLKDYELVEFTTISINNNRFGILDQLKKIIKSDDIIIFQSGYCTEDDHPDHRMHKIIIENFPNNAIIALPQTVLLKSQKEIDITSTIFNEHKKLYFITRDMVSYNMSQKMFKNTKVDVCPDIVTTLIGKYKFNTERKGILFCMRNDNEKLIVDSEIELIIKELDKYERINRWDTTVNCNTVELRKNFKSVFEDILEKFASYKLVITDRFHGTIFSLIASTPVIVLPTNDHKVLTGADWFLEDYSQYVYKLNDLSELKMLIEKVLSIKHSYLIEDIFENKYYRPLIDKVIKVIGKDNIEDESVSK